MIIQGEETVQIKDYWIAAVGDSFASGEGNPDVPAKISTTSPAQWLSGKKKLLPNEYRVTT